MAASETSPPTGLRKVAEDYRHFGARCAVTGLAYRVFRRFSQIKSVHVLSLELAGLSPPPSPCETLEYRCLTPDDIRTFAADPTNDLVASMAERLATGRDFCFAGLDGPKLASYSWYALDSIEPEHSFDAGISFPKDTVYLYKAYTHPEFRGRRIHHSIVVQAARFFADRGVSRMIALVEFANWASLNSHARLGFREVGRMLVGGRAWKVARYPRLAETMGLRFGGES